MALSTCCTQTELLRFLGGGSAPDEETRVLVHLDTCPACQQALEDCAGDRAWWNEVGEQLSSSSQLAADSGVTNDSTRAFPTSQHLATESIKRQLKNMLAPSDDPSMLGRLGTYEIRGLIGRGGAGMVMKAFDPALSRFVAIKMLLPHWADNPSARERFAREARAAAAVAHEHVTPIHAVDEFRGVPFIVMKYVVGGSLEQRLKKEGRLGLAQALRVALQTAQALAAAHEQGLVHRDVKPANILLEPGVERVMVTDFGLARSAQDATLTCTGFVAGTPKYMSPEQAKGEPIDGRSDLFGLGCVLYELSAGKPPFDGDNLISILRQVCDVPHKPLREVAPDMPVWLAALVDRLLSKEREERFQSAQQLADALAAELAHLQNPHGTPTPVRDYMRRTRRLGRRVIIGAVLTLSVALASAWMLFTRSQGDGQALQSPSNTASKLVAENVIDGQLMDVGKQVRDFEARLQWPDAAYAEDGEPMGIALLLTEMEQSLVAELSELEAASHEVKAKPLRATEPAAAVEPGSSVSNR